MTITRIGRTYFVKNRFSGGKERIYSCQKCNVPMTGADSYSGSEYCYKCISDSNSNSAKNIKK